jgi:predicted SAM-dependent methyltransferase
MKIVSPDQAAFAAAAAINGIRYADVARRIPHPDDSVHLVYSSHMLEHLERTQALAFLNEVWRVLVPGGILRLAVPDLASLVDEYVRTGDADLFITKSYLARQRPKTGLAKLSWLLMGDRDHSWMYDGESLSKLLCAAGFDAPQVLGEGKTTITNPGALDLHERADESVYVEARKPAGRKA